MKPILFNTEMVQAILSGQKTVTRRVMKRQPGIECTHGGQHEFIRDDFIEGSSFTGFVCKKCGYGVCWPHFKFPVGTSWIRPPYCPGDILYVRETWCDIWNENGTWSSYGYQANGEPVSDYWGVFRNGVPIKSFKWRPSIHMPKDAARIFLRVTDVRVERLQDISSQDIEREGIDLTDLQGLGCITRNEYVYAFQTLWNSTLKPADRALYGWDANPYVWVIEFERCEKPELVGGAECE